MKSNHMQEGGADESGRVTFSGRCLRSCQKIVARMREAKDAILAESRGALAAQERMLKLALNEAEALAWQTTYPHLVFPTLAMEKVQAVAEWSQHQQSVRPEGSWRRLAA